MSSTLEEIIVNEVTQDIKSIIAQVKEEQEQANNVSAIKTLAIVNKRISNWTKDTESLLDLSNEKIANAILQAKSELVSEVKNEVAADIAAIVTDGKGCVTERINEYLNELKDQGIYFDNEKEDTLSPVAEQSGHKKLARDLVNTTPSRPLRNRSYESSCNDYGCGSGSSSGCGGGGC